MDGVYVANVADQKAEPELKLLGGLQAVLFNIHVCPLFLIPRGTGCMSARPHHLRSVPSVHYP